MTVEKLIEVLGKYPPNLRAFTYNAKGEMIEVDSAEMLAGDDDVWHEKQSDDALFLS